MLTVLSAKVRIPYSISAVFFNFSSIICADYLSLLREQEAWENKTETV
jgi:hypothetical protein